jgi:hypothetical protein
VTPYVLEIVMWWLAFLAVCAAVLIGAGLLDRYSAKWETRWREEDDA